MYPFFLRAVLKVSLVNSDTGQPPSDKEKDLDRGSMRGSVTHTDVTKDKKGRLVLVQHRDKSAGAWTGGGGDQGGSQDVKNEGSQNGKADEKKESPADEDDLKFTAEQDADLIKLKAEDPNMQWAKIGEILNRDKGEAKQRYAELKHLGKVSAGDVKGESKEDKSKPDENKQNAKQNESKKDPAGESKPGEGDWTAVEDAIIKEGMVKGDNAQKIASGIKNRVKKEVGARIGYLKQQEREQTKKAEETKDSTVKNVKADGNEGQQDQTKKEKKEERKNHAEQQKAKQDNGSRKEEFRSKAPSSKAASSRSEAKFTMGEWMTLQEDDMFSFRELQLLSELIMLDARESRDGAYSWLRVASLFADRTDRRVHPEDIREKFEAMARD